MASTMKQYVCVGGVNSNIFTAFTVWGTARLCPWPYTFSYIYINDTQFVTNFIDLVLYVDDINLLVSDKSLKKSVTVLNKELARLEKWFQANKPTINLSRWRLANSIPTRHPRNLLA